MTIEPLATEEDRERCAQMMSQSEPWITLQRDLDGCREAMRGEYKESYVAREGDELLGFIVLQMSGVLTGYIQSICVAPAARGRNIGSALIQVAEERIFSVSPNVFMFVSSFNTRAFELYSRLGYEKIGTVKNFVADGYDEFLLRKTRGSWQSFRKKSPAS